QKLNEKFALNWSTKYSVTEQSVKKDVIIPNNRRYYLLEIADTVRNYHKKVEEQVKIGRRLFQIEGALQMAKEEGMDEEVIASLEELRNQTEEKLTPESREILQNWENLKET